MNHLALVTGAASGMGQLSAWRLAATDVEVLALDIDEEGLDRTARRAPQVRPVVCDVSDAEAVRAVVEKAEAGGASINRVVNAAAILTIGHLADLPAATVARTMASNFEGLVNVTLAVLPGMLARRRGDVVQFASLAGWLPSPALGAYSASKAAVLAFSETLFHEIRGSGVRVVCACPPPVHTPMLERAMSIPEGARTLGRTRAIRPEQVLDGIESALDAGDLFTFAGRGTATIWRLRRFVPELVWRRVEAGSGLRR